MSDNLRKAPPALLLIAIFFVSINLRPAVAAIGPLVSQIIADTGITSTVVGLLTMIPVFLMGLGAIYVRQTRAVLGESGGIALGALIVAIASLARYWLPSGAGLLVTAVGAGIGITIVQSLMPGFAKRNYGGSTSRVIGVYSTGIVVGAAIAAGTAAGISDAIGWAGALAVWSAPAVFAVLLWRVASRHAASDSEKAAGTPAANTSPPAFWRSARCWSLMVFFGVGTGAFMLAMAWIPPFYLEQGIERSHAGLLLSVLTVIEAITALGIATFIHHFPDRRGPLAFSLLVTVLGFAVLFFRPLELSYAAMALLGIGIGILFPLSIIVAIDHIDDPTSAGNFTSFVQGGGYIIASFVPLIAGAVRDVLSDLSRVWLVMAAGSLLMIMLAARYSPASCKRFSQSLSTSTALGTVAQAKR
ncbi:MFS transporter (plasmid) [Rhizobium sp. CB3171]|uniref:MFS transporter n=1 Tax=Rhizobium sp. CB3171 TaxID=3039157 RepID=UPI0024B1A2A1|nr:MFS transporter [Rhizobium sp. CB3171]WFU07210.1 MFS transporter [Rhizobium sp. CB3171]